MKEFEGNFYIKKIGTGYHLIVEGGRFAEENIEKQEVAENAYDIPDKIGEMVEYINNEMEDKDNKKRLIKDHKEAIERLENN